MSSDPWDDDWVPKAASSSQQPSESYSIPDIKPSTKYEIQDTTTTHTSYKPQLKLLKRDNSNSPNGSGSNTPSDSSSKPLNLEQQFQIKQQNYLKAREKIFGSASPEPDSQQQRTKRIQERHSPKPQR